MARDNLFRFGGEFLDSAREATFRQARLAETLRQCRLIFLVSAVLNTLFLASDWRFYGTSHFFVAVPARLLVVAASLLCYALVRKATRFDEAQTILIGWEVATALAVALLVSSRSDLALFVVLMLPSIFYLVAPTAFRWTIALGIGCSVLMLAGYLGRGPFPTTLPGLVLVLVMLNFALGLVVIHGNRLRRLEWTATQAERQAKDALGVSQAMIERLFMAVPIPLVVASREDGRFLRSNDAAKRYFGREQLATARVSDILFAERDRREILLKLERQDQIAGYEAQMRGGDGVRRDVLITATGVPIDGGLAVVAGIVDITDRKAAEARTRRQATHDALTGLPNRLLFQERLQQALDVMAEAGGTVSLFLIDLDDFKSVNDTLGHDAGDELLFQAAARLAGAIGPADMVARLGGDEFVVLSQEALDIDGARLKGAILLDALREPFEHAGQMISARASLGIALAPEHDLDGGELMKDADLALYRAKARGRNIAVVYEPLMRAAMIRRVAICRDLAEALREDRILPFYQPQVSLADGKIAGFEALARWRHPERGIIPAAAFQEAFQDVEIAAGIGDAIVRAVLRDLRQWLDAGLDPGVVSVNLSAGIFRDPELPERLLGKLATAGVPARCFGLEVTESVLLTRSAGEAERTLQALRAAGLHVSLDDFGTGYASLTHLKRFPVDTIKLDRGFVSQVEEEGDDAAIVRAMIGLAADLGLGIVAEGVETPGQEAFLRRHGCGLAQGYRYARPVAAARVPLLLQQPNLFPGASAMRDDSAAA
ncbi:GGDEF and EAL domain-containing protein [Bosea sp. WAO]|uniref:putative bifunctional diguanylate cyclase/phosphodiesterase n=1 Tax=Bosea sp. WAO TaxID=406341 RepID=UPI0008369E02|nr:GGDEF and EAL domain-containing protein [Bosea sp. WAO]